MATFTPPPALTVDDLLAVLERNFAQHWIGPLLEDPSSRSYFVATAEALLRVQTSIDINLWLGTYILSSVGASAALSTLRLERPSGAAGTIPATTRFLDERGAVWIPTADFDVAASGGVQTIDVPVVTFRQGYYLNTFLPPSFRILDDLFDSSFFVIDGPDPATDGQTASLDQHGIERAMPRALSELDQQYRNRLVFLSDLVSPKALAETTFMVLESYPLSAIVALLVIPDGARLFTEPFFDGAQQAQYNLRGRRVGFLDDADPNLGLFFDDPNGSEMVDRAGATAWFDVYIPTLVDPVEGRRFYDDSDPILGSYLDYVYPDVPISELLLQPVAALADELDRRRAGGVGGRIWEGYPIHIERTPILETQAGAWLPEGTDNPADAVTALRRYDGDDAYIATPTGAGAGAAASVSDWTGSVPATHSPDSVVAVVLRAWVRRASLGVGVDPEFAFVIRPSSSGSAFRTLLSDQPKTIDHDDWRQVVLILEENPDTAAPWVPGDVAGSFEFGVANTAAVGTDELRVSELVLEIISSYG